MSRTESFLATVGVLLIENNPCLPWRSPLPPALTGARGWYLPSGAGPMILLVLAADGLGSTELTEIQAQWRAWLETLRAGESLLCLTWEETPGAGLPAAELGADGPWPVWLVDLQAERVERLEPPDEEAPFAQTVDGVVASYFDGAKMRLSDLAEQERARSAGEVPFGVFLASQRPMATWVLLGVIAIFYVLAEALGGSTNTLTLLRAGANFRPLVEQGELWRLVTANFLHIGIWHLLINAYSLYAIGPMLERLYGTWKFLAVYVFAGITGAVASFWFNGHGISAGASGALFGLIGAMLVIGVRHQGAIPDHHRRSMRTLAAMALAINLAFGMQVPGIDNFAHLGGLVGGTLLALGLGPHPMLLGRRGSPWTPRWLGVLPLTAICALVLGLGYTWRSPEPAWTLTGPRQDFTLRAPIHLEARRAQGTLFLYASGNQHWIEVASAPNPAGEPNTGRPALAEATLEAYGSELAHALSGSGVRVLEPVTVERRGHHRYARLLLGRGDDREEAYVTATEHRLYVIKTRGLAAQSWIAPTLNQVLTSFRIQENPAR